MFSPQLSILPQAFQVAVQQNYLQRALEEALKPVLQYRLVAEKMTFPGKIGTTITETRTGLLIPNITPLDPSKNTNIDNGLTPQYYTSEQYTLGIQQYPQGPILLNLADDQTTIVSFIMKNVENLGIAAATAIDTLARNALFNAYMGGNTFVDVTLGAPSTSLHVDDIRGFDTAFFKASGKLLPVSVSNPLPVLINGIAYNVVGVLADATNISLAKIIGGISGTLTLSSAVSTTNGTAGNTVISTKGAQIFRPNGKGNTTQLLSSDTLDMATCRQSVAYLRSNNVPLLNGYYNIYVSPQSMTQLYADNDFKLLNRGRGTNDPVYKDLLVYEFSGMRFIETTQAPVQYGVSGSLVPTTIQRPIVCGGDALLEGTFEAGKDAILEMIRENGIGEIEQRLATIPIASYDGIWQYMRLPIDQLGQIVTQTGNWIGGFTVPTDVTTTSDVIYTASNAFYKRAVVIETGT